MSIQKPAISRIGIPSENYGNGRRSSISQISEHHAVGDARHVIAKAKDPTKQFSCTFTIGTDGTIYQLVDLEDTPYTDNDYRSNGRSITIEHAGGGDFPYTEAMYQSSIKLHAWLFSLYGDLNCIGHKDIPEIKADPRKATACPGGLDYGRIVREAKQLLTNGGSEVNRKDAASMAFWGRLAANQSVEMANANAENDTNQIVANPAYAGALMKQIYDGNELVRWKANNYDNLGEAMKALQAQVTELSERPTKEKLAELKRDFDTCMENARLLEQQKQDDTKAADSFLRRLGQFIKKYLP